MFIMSRGIIKISTRLWLEKSAFDTYVTYPPKGTIKLILVTQFQNKK